MRARSWKPTSVDQQETLGDLIRRFDELGVERMAKEVFQTNHGSTDATIRKAKNILRAAKVLRHIGIDVLQDIPVRIPDEIDDALQCLPEVSAGTIRRFLMYTGDDDFVRGDVGVRNFVSIALSRRAISGKARGRTGPAMRVRADPRAPIPGLRDLETPGRLNPLPKRGEGRRSRCVFNSALALIA